MLMFMNISVVLRTPREFYKWIYQGTYFINKCLRNKLIISLYKSALRITQLKQYT